jgi:hypothetical protein
MKTAQIHAVSEKLEQFHHENQTWVRSIDFFKQENAYLKNRLSQVVDRSFDKNFLAQAEHFQNQFIIKDEFMDELKHDVNEQSRILRDRYLKNGLHLDEVAAHRQMNLRDQIEFLEKDFTKLRNEFNTYLAKML